MRIVLLSTQFADYSVEAALALSKRADVLLIVDADHVKRDCDPSRVAELLAAKRVCFFQQRRKPHRVVACAKTLLQIVRYRPDVVVAHEHPHAHVAWMHRWAARVAPVMLTVHDPVAHSGRDGEFALRNARWTKNQRASASGFLVHGAHCSNALVRTVSERPVVSVPHGPILVGGVVEASNTPSFLMFGRMEAYKGLEVLLRAARILVERNGVAPIHIAGSGPELDRLYDEFSCIPGVTVHRGFVPRDVAIRQIAKSSAILLPYTEATQSGVVSAAFAGGRSVIASTVGGIPDFVRNEENGLLVRPNDPAALADAMGRFINELGLRDRLAAGARLSAETEMSWDAYARAVVALATRLSRRENNLRLSR